MAPGPIEHKLAAILSADAVGYSRLMADDETATIQTISSYREQIEALVGKHRGRVVDAPGDNVLAEFPTALEAVQCALETQGVLGERNASLPSDRRMDFRIGIHMGDVATEGERIYGDGVNIAARLEALAEAGGVCISATVHEQVRNKLDAGFTDLGDQTVKNIPDQVRVYRLEAAGAEKRSRPGASPLRRSGALGKQALVAALLLALIGGALWATWPKPLGLLIDLAGVGSLPTDPALPDKPSLVVLPFENLSADPDQEYFSDGMTEELTNALSRSPFLFVIARNSAFTYKGRHAKVEDIGRELGVRYVLEGSARKAGDRVRVTAQLVEASTGGHIWSEQYDRELSDIFALQSEIAVGVAGAVGGEILRAEQRRLANRPTANLTAYEAVQKATTFVAHPTRANLEMARALVTRAIEIDPGFAQAHSLLGATYWGEYGAGWNRDPALLERAEAAGRRAVELDPSFVQGHAVLGWVAFLRDDFEGAVVAADQAIELAPSFAVAHTLRGLALARQGQLLEGTRSVRHALRLNPRAPLNPVLLAVAYVNLAADRRKEGIAFLEKARESAPEVLPARVALAALYGQEPAPAKARAEVADMLRVRPDLTVESAMELLPLVAALSDEELASYRELLHAAGLPSR